MNWTVRRHDLPLSTPSGIARGTAATVERVAVELSCDGTTGYGAVTPSTEPCCWIRTRTRGPRSTVTGSTSDAVEFGTGAR
jgi:hypothetical protein